MAELNDRLVVVLEAKIDKLSDGIDKAVAKVAGGGARIQKVVEQTNHSMSRFGEFNPGEAFERVFSRARLATFEEGGAKIGLFGNALEALGPAGLAAAAGLAAVGIAGERARQAMEWADELDRQAKSLGVTTTALQQFDYASVASSVGLEQGRQALSSFNEVLGKYSAGLAPGKVGKFLDALGFTPASTRNITDVGAATQQVLEALGKVPNQAQRAGIASALGLSAFLPVLGEGEEGVKKYIGLMQDAQAAGGVISPESIARAAEMNDNVERLEHLVSVKLKSAFIDLAPAIQAVAEIINDIAGSIAATARVLEHISDIEHQIAAQAPKQSKVAFQASQLIENIPGTGPLAARAMRAALGVDDKGNPIKPPVVAPPQPLANRAGADYSKPAKAKAAPQDVTGSFDKAAVDAYQSALKAAHTALAALIDDVDAHAAAEKAAVDDDLTKKLADLSEQEAKIRAAKNDAHRSEQLALVEKAKTEEQNAAKAKKELIDRDAEEEAARRAAAFDAAIANARAGQLEAEASITANAAKRAELEIRAFQERQDAARATRETDIDNDHTKTPEQRDSLKAAGRATDTAERISERDRQARSASPLYDYAHPLQDLSTEVQSSAVQGLQNLNEELAKAVTGTESLGDAFHNIAQSIIADLAKIAIQKAVTEPLANLLGSFFPSFGNIFKTGGSVAAGNITGHATGSDNFGGVTRINEQGPEGVAFLPRGTQIIPNATLRAIANMGVPQRGSGVGTLAIKIDLAGANGDAAIAAAARVAALQGAQTAIAHTNARFDAAARRQRYSR